MKLITYPDLLVFRASSEVLAVRTEAYASYIQVTRLCGGFIHKNTDFPEVVSASASFDIKKGNIPCPGASLRIVYLRSAIAPSSKVFPIGREPDTAHNTK